MISKIDYLNSFYVSLPNYLPRKLQSVINGSARLIYFLPPLVPTVLYVFELYWLPVKARIELRFFCWLLTLKGREFRIQNKTTYRTRARSGVPYTEQSPKMKENDVIMILSSLAYITLIRLLF